MFKSEFSEVGRLVLPNFSGTRVMMLPVLLSEPESLPDDIQHYRAQYNALCCLAPCKSGVAYLTIDEKRVEAGSTHRRAGLHVDGIGPKGYVYGGWGGGGGGWGGNGMLTVANPVGCRAWNQNFDGYPGEEGDCEHLRPQLSESVTFKANVVYQLSGLCVHESIPQSEAVDRQFVRLSMPSNSPWFEGYTVNPKGVLPTGPILSRREYMDV